MAQTRAHKIGTVYSRVRALLEKKALNAENKPVWYEIYEAFPPKYEPRFDRHLLPFGTGSAVSKIPDARKILYEEDQVRAKYYKVFMPKRSENREANLASEEVFNLLDTDDLARKTLSQIFIEKHQKLEKDGKVAEDDLFLNTVEALEIDGIDLRGRPQVISKEDNEVKDTPPGKVQFPSVSDLMSASDEKEK